VAAGFDLLTYKKGKSRPEPRASFLEHELVDDLGRHQSYWLADRQCRFSYKDAKRARYFAARQVTRLDPNSGHQTQVVTTRADLSAAEVAYWCFCRWRQENFFRYMRHRCTKRAVMRENWTTNCPRARYCSSICASLLI
jgi:hypothetical protein